MQVNIANPNDLLYRSSFFFKSGGGGGGDGDAHHRVEVIYELL
jgi:hypothetical protein